LYNLHSPIAVNFPNKVKNKSFGDFKGIIPSIDLSKTKNKFYTLENKALSKTPKKIKEIISNKEIENLLLKANISNEELKRLYKNKLLEKVFKAILMVNEVIIEKNNQIESLNTEIEKLKAMDSKQKNQIAQFKLKLDSLQKENKELLDNHKLESVETSMVNTQFNKNNIVKQCFLQ